MDKNKMSDAGQEALVRLEGHEKQCIERMEEIRHSISAMSARIWWLLGASLGGLSLLALEFLKTSHP